MLILYWIKLLNLFALELHLILILGPATRIFRIWSIITKQLIIPWTSYTQMIKLFIHKVWKACWRMPRPQIKDKMELLENCMNISRIMWRQKQKREHLFNLVLQEISKYWPPEIYKFNFYCSFFLFWCVRSLSRRIVIGRLFASSDLNTHLFLQNLTNFRREEWNRRNRRRLTKFF